MRAGARGREALAGPGTQQRRGQAGQSLAEFALILIVLMLIVMGIIDLSRAVYVRSLVANAAREGARAALVLEPETGDSKLEAVVTAAVTGKVAGLDPSELSISVSRPTVTYAGSPAYSVTYVLVEVTYTFRPVTGLIARAAGIGPGGVVLTGSSKMRREW